MKKRLSIAMAIFAFFALSVSAQTKKKGNDLDDKSYTINLTKTSGKSSGWQLTTDDISFKGGMLRSKMMREHEKFEDASCDIVMEANSSGKTMTFKAEKENKEGSKVKWKGKVTGDHIEGTMVWKNKQGTESYTFTGNKKEN